MPYAIAFVALCIVCTVVLWIFALMFGNSTDLARLLGSAFVLAIGGFAGLALRRRSLQPKQR